MLFHLGTHRRVRWCTARDDTDRLPWQLAMMYVVPIDVVVALVPPKHHKLWVNNSDEHTPEEFATALYNNFQNPGKQLLLPYGEQLCLQLQNCR